MTTIAFIGICIVGFIILLIGYWYVDKWHASLLEELNEYEVKYNMMQRYIRSCSVTHENYESIERMFCCLNKLPYKNKEKTSVLYVTEFLLKFESEIKRRRSEEEFTSEEIFRQLI